MGSRTSLQILVSIRGKIRVWGFRGNNQRGAFGLLVEFYITLVYYYYNGRLEKYVKIFSNIKRRVDE